MISGAGMANLEFYRYLPMGISNYGGDIQVYNVQDYIYRPIQLCFNPLAQMQFNCNWGGGGGISVPSINMDVDALAEAFLAPVMENLALGNVNSNNSTLATLETRLNSLLEAEGVTEDDKKELNKLLEKLKEQKTAMESLEDESLTNKEIYTKSEDISTAIKEISKEITKIEKAIKERIQAKAKQAESENA